MRIRQSALPIHRSVDPALVARLEMEAPDGEVGPRAPGSSHPQIR